MFLEKYNVIGILGGMGPEATIDLYRRIVRSTPVEKDQDHIPVLIFSNPKIPDRTASISSRKTKKIIAYLKESAAILEDGGADFIVIPCNTAHVFYGDIAEEVYIPVIHMIEITVAYIIDHYPDMKVAGLLGTSGTISTGLYQKVLGSHGISPVVPEKHVLDSLVMSAIYAIKAGKKLKDAREKLVQAISLFPEAAQRLIIMGCTEIPLAFEKPLDNTILINPTQILADAAVRMSMSGLD